MSRALLEVHVQERVHAPAAAKVETLILDSNTDALDVLDDVDLVGKGTGARDGDVGNLGGRIETEELVVVAVCPVKGPGRGHRVEIELPAIGPKNRTVVFQYGNLAIVEGLGGGKNRGGLGLEEAVLCQQAVNQIRTRAADLTTRRRGWQLRSGHHCTRTTEHDQPDKQARENSTAAGPGVQARWEDTRAHRHLRAHGSLILNPVPPGSK
jgi:hypothetical protein